MDPTQAAIALNNIGVRLLERSCYSQGLEVLRDAVSSLRNSLNCTGESLQAHHTQMFEMHTRAMNSLANPQREWSSMCLEVVSSELLYAKACYAISQDPNTREAFPILIERSDHDSANEYPAVETAMVLYNFAVAHLCLSSVPHLSRANHFTAAKTLFSSSYTVLHANIAEFLADEALTIPFLSLEVLVLSKFLAVLQEMNEMEQAKVLRIGFAQLVDAMHLVDSFEECFRQHKRAAAAA